MYSFESLLKSYFELPYRPEFLVKKVREELKNYIFKLAKESSNEINQSNYNQVFKKIFGARESSYTFNKNVSDSNSIENFKNFVFENCKLTYENMKIKEILLYCFLLEEFDKPIIDAIYRSKIFINSNKEKDIYKILFNNFLDTKHYYKSDFDKIYLPIWIDNKLCKKKYFNKGSNNNKKLLFDPENIKLNYSIYEYYGPNATKLNFILNQKDFSKKKVTLFSPDFLIENKILEEYTEENFQVFNENNSCPGLFIFIMQKALKELNNKLKGKDMEDDTISDIGIIKFNDNTVGLYLNKVNCSQYYEMENLVNKLRDNKHASNLEVVVNKSSIATVSKENKEETEEQKRYKYYNSYVTEEQLTSAIINSIGNEILNEGMERLPRIIYYFNLYVLKSLKEKTRVIFVNREDGYGFEEIDGVFYLENKNVILNEPNNIPFLKRIGFQLNPNRYTNYLTFNLDEENTKIFLEQNSLICMEVKNSFPLKYNNGKIEGINETTKLIYSFIKKSKKFYDISKINGKNIKKIHILFLYDSFLQASNDMEILKNTLSEIFESITIEVDVKTTFDIVYFVNPASFNSRKLSNIVIKLKRENI